MIGCLRTRVRKQSIIALYFEFKPELKFYNLEAWFHVWEFLALLILLLSSADFFSKLTSSNIISRTLWEFQTAWTNTILSVLIWVQTVCKGYQQMIKVAASKERVKITKIIIVTSI